MNLDRQIAKLVDIHEGLLSVTGENNSSTKGYLQMLKHHINDLQQEQSVTPLTTTDRPIGFIQNRAKEHPTT